MTDKGEKVDFGNPKQAAFVLHNAGRSLLGKVQMGETVSAQDLAEGLAFVLLAMAGQARHAIENRQEQGQLVKPAVFQGTVAGS